MRAPQFADGPESRPPERCGGSSLPLSAGDRLGAYEIVAPLGAGGMGEVYRARDTKLGPRGRDQGAPRRVGAATASASARFEREARSCWPRSTIPTSARFTGSMRPAASSFLVLELVRGRDLSEHVKRGRWRPARRSRSPRQIADWLSKKRTSKGIVHRDLKPANVKLTRRRQGQGPRLRPRESACDRLPAAGSFESGHVADDDATPRRWPG